MASEYKPNLGVETITASTTINADAFAGRTVRLSSASGLTITLPAATGRGVTFDFIVATTLSSGNYIVRVGNGTDVMRGMALILGSALGGFAHASDSDTITLNGTTTGGAPGSRITVTDAAPGSWKVLVHGIGSSTAATPFSATVS